MTSVAYGGTIGFVTGGINSYMNGGNIASGMLIGGASGMASGGLGSAIVGSGLKAMVTSGVMSGGVGSGLESYMQGNSWGQVMTDTATGGAIGGLTGGLFRTMGPRISSALGRTFNAGCFVAGTQVHISHLPNDIGLESQVWTDAGWLDRHVDLNVSSLGELASCGEYTSSTETSIASPQSARCGLLLEANRTTPRSLPIEEVPLGSRVPTKNPRPWEFDDSLPEPDQATWVKLSLTMHRADGGVVDAELLRPGWWIEANEIQPGKPLPMNLAELEVYGSALVTAIEPCPPIADGDGSVVTARFVTREVHELARLEILGPDGEVETVTGTPIHPIWSEDRQDWVPLGELLSGETLRTSTGLAQVHSLTLLTHPVPVYNIEIHGEHVYQVGVLGLLVHNAYSQLRQNMIKAFGHPGDGWEAAHIIAKSGFSWAPKAFKVIQNRVKKLGLIDDVANGFWSTRASGHAGTHSKAYIDDLIRIMAGRQTRQEVIDGLNLLWSKIKGNAYL
jgi:hypothetical protein